MSRGLAQATEWQPQNFCWSYLKSSPPFYGLLSLDTTCEHEAAFFVPHEESLLKNEVSTEERRTERDSKEEVHSAGEPRTSTVCRGRPMGELTGSSSLGGLSADLLLREVSLFLLRPSTDWMRPTHIREDNLLYSKIKC